MKRLLTHTALLTVFSLTVLPVNAVSAGETMPAHLATQLGLEQAWQRQIQLPNGAQSIVDQQIYVHTIDQREYVEIVADAKPDDKAASPNATPASPQTLVRIPTDRVGINGEPIGKPEAERLARAELRRLSHRGYKAKITSRTVPRIRLYSLGTDGTVECRDAESGEPIWMTRVGDRRLGYSKMGINDKFLTVINADSLIKIDVVTGEEMQTVRTVGTPLFGAVHSGDFSLVPTIRNGVEGYPLADPSVVPFMEIVEGIALAPPTKAPDSTRVAWATNRGFVYVMELQGKPSVLFRLNTDGIVSGRIAAANDGRFYFGSESGQVYGIWATRTGKVLWSKPYGEPFYHAPMVVGNQLLLRSTYGNLYSLSTTDGIMTWTDTVPNVDALLGAFNGKLFVRLLSGGFAVIDLEKGKLINTYYELLPRQLLVNSQTDRLYLVGKTGSVQCLRPTGAILPTFNEATKNVGADKEPTAGEEPVGPKAAFADQAPAKDPFGDAKPADPFAGAGADPFGAGDAAGGEMADPFGAPGDGEMADPFGADPFGN